jgi:methanogenic corrinoid protein MtbC1
VLELTRGGLGAGPALEATLFDALIPLLEQAGARFERGSFRAGDARRGAQAVVRRSTVTDEVPDIGQNLVNIMPEGRGFPVIDLAVQVSPEKVVAKILEHEPDIVGFSAFMPMFKADINVLQKAGLRDQVIVMVGGAPATGENADAGGADGDAAGAAVAVAGSMMWNSLTTVWNRGSFRGAEIR